MSKFIVFGIISGLIIVGCRVVRYALVMSEKYVNEVDEVIKDNEIIEGIIVLVLEKKCREAEMIIRERLIKKGVERRFASAFAKMKIIMLRYKLRRRNG